MERGKKGGRGRPPPPGDELNLIALGKGRRGGTARQLGASGEFKLQKLDKKEGLASTPSSTSPLAALPPPIQAAPQYSHVGSSSSSISNVEEFVGAVQQAVTSEDREQLSFLVLQGLAGLQERALEPPQHLYLALILIAKKFPDLFRQGKVFERLLSLLSRAHPSRASFKRNNTVLVLVCNLLLRGFTDEPNWPTAFVETFMEDSLTDRLWVDDERNKVFVENILTVLPQKPSQSAQVGRLPDIKSEQALKSSLHEEEYEDEVESGGSVVESGVGSEESKQMSIVQARYADETVRNHLQQYIIKTTLDSFSVQHEAARSLIKTCTAAVSLKEIRMRSSESVEDWLNNPSTIRFVKELLTKLVLYCSGNAHEDFTTVANILKLRVKGMHAQLWSEAVVQLVKNNPEYPLTAIRYFIYNEILNGKSLVNPKVFIHAFKLIKDPEEKLAFILQDLAANEAHRGNVRLLLKRIATMFNGELDYVSLCKGLMQEPQVSQEQANFAWISTLVDIVCFAQILSIPPSLNELAVKENLSNVAKEFRLGIATVQMEAMRWFHMNVPKFLSNAPPQAYAQLLKRILFLETSSQLFAEVSPEAEKYSLKLLTSQIPVYEDTITALVLMGLTKQLPLSSPEALEILEHLIRRGASGSTVMEHSMEIKNGQLIEAILQLSWYQPPQISEEELATFPQFAVTAWFWQAAVLVLILLCFNPETLGPEVWAIPTLRKLVEVIITRDWKSAEQKNEEEIELQRQEIKQILALETRLAQATRQDGAVVQIDEKNSILGTQLLTYRLEDKPRSAPAHIIGKLQPFDREFRLGHKLCSCRSPDFLLNIMKEQGALRSMAWLGPIIQSDPETLDVLPIACLCELVLSQANGSIQVPHLQARLLQTVSGPDTVATAEILEFFVEKLTSVKGRMRETAKESLAGLLSRESQVDASDYGWVDRLDSLPGFRAATPIVVRGLRRALQNETNPQAVNKYISYLYSHTTDELDTISLAMDISNLLLTRYLIVGQLLLNQDFYFLMLKIFTKVVGYGGKSSKIDATIGQSVTVKTPTKSCLFLPLQIVNAIIQLFSHTETEIYLEGENKVLAVLHEQLLSKFIDGSKIAEITDQQNRVYPLISHPQALRLVHSGNPALVEAGLDKLGISDCLSTISSFGLSPFCINAVVKKASQSPEALHQVDQRLVEKARDALGIYHKMGAIDASQLTPQLAPSLPLALPQKTKKLTGLEIKPAAIASPFQQPSMSAFLTGAFLSVPAVAFSSWNLVYLILEGQGVSDCIDALFRLDQSNLATALDARSSLSIPMFYLLFWKVEGDQRDRFMALTVRISDVLSTTTSPFGSFLKHILKRTELQPQNPPFLEETFLSPASQMEDAVERTVIEAICQNGIRPSHRSQMVSKLTSQLQQTGVNHGLILDWLLLVDPSLISAEMRNLIFMKSNQSALAGGVVSCLLSLAIHTAPWQTLVEWWQWLQKGFMQSGNPSSVLEFIAALVLHPRSWAGATGGYTSAGSVGSLTVVPPPRGRSIFTPVSVCIIIDYLLASDSFSAHWANLLLSTSISQETAHILVVHLFNRITHDKAHFRTAESLLTHVYMTFPTVVTSLCRQYSTSFSLPKASGSHSNGLTLVLHGVVRRLMDSGTSNSNSAYLACRKIAFSHPSLVMSYLDTIGSLVSGRSHLPVEEFVEGQHHRLFQHLLGILDALRPQVFESPVLGSILRTYFVVLSGLRSQNKTFGPLIGKLVDFLCHYAVAVSPSIIPYQLFKDLFALYPDIQKIQLLLDIQSKGPQFFSQITQPDLLPKTQKELVRSRLCFIEKDHEHLTTLLETLKDIDKSTLRSPSLLIHFMEELVQLLASPSIEVRQIVSPLLLRLLHHFPRETSNEILKGYLLSLRSEDHSVQRSALDLAPEFFYHSEDCADYFLEELFHLGKVARAQLATILHSKIHTERYFLR